MIFLSKIYLLKLLGVRKKPAMDENNYIDIDLSRRNQFIYRIISVERLFEMFKNKRNVLVKPKKWEDPFENFILRSKVKLPSGDLATFGFQDHFFGQCWTLNTASDAMWRIYSPKANAVRIRSNVASLASSLEHSCGDWAHVEVFIGKVKYFPNKSLVEYANTVFTNMSIPSSRLFAETLLIKRPAFKHEREVRLLFLPHNEDTAKNDLYSYDIDPHALISQIMIDPRLAKTEADALKERIRKSTGYRRSIKRSLLYAAPPAFVIPFGKTPNNAFNTDAPKRCAG